jgi:hypothetical protein
MQYTHERSCPCVGREEKKRAPTNAGAPPKSPERRSPRTGLHHAHAALEATLT